MRSVYSDMFRNAGHFYGKDEPLVHYMIACLLYKAGARSFAHITSVGKSDLANRTDGYLVNMPVNRSDFAGDIGLDPGPFLERWRSPKMEHILKGMFASNESELMGPGIGTGNSPWEEAAGPAQNPAAFLHAPFHPG